MIVSIDGAVKKPGTEDCLSVGCAFFPELSGTDLYRLKVEPTGSTSQRGEINGLLTALSRVVELREAFQYEDDTVVILTDSQYLHDTVTCEWLQKWRAAGWIAANGEEPKNCDQWKVILDLIEKLESYGITVVMQWTKGHIFKYPASKITACLREDTTGTILLSAINSMMSIATARETVVNAFNKERREHGFAELPPSVAAEYVLYNTTTDSIAVYIANLVQAAKNKA